MTSKVEKEVYQMGKTPDYRAVTKVADKRWEEIGAAWAKEENISIQLKFNPLPQNGRVNFLLVPYANGEDLETEEN